MTGNETQTIMEAVEQANKDCGYGRYQAQEVANGVQIKTVSSHSGNQTGKQTYTLPYELQRALDDLTTGTRNYRTRAPAVAARLGQTPPLPPAPELGAVLRLQPEQLHLLAELLGTHPDPRAAALLETVRHEQDNLKAIGH